MKIQLVTINTWKCDGDYFKRRQILADQLKKLTPHIIACQECFLTKDETIDTLRFLAEELDMYYHFTPARLKPRMLNNDIVMSYSGLGVLSAFRLKPLNEFELPTSDADGERKAQQLVMELADKKKLLLTNVHLTHLSGAEALRKEQLNLIIQNITNVDYAYNLVCGDFNAIPDSEEISFFTSRSGAVDCYELGNGEEPRKSLNTGGSGKNVDYIFTLPQPDVYTAFSKSGVVLNEPDYQSGIFPSDHFGISTTLITV